MIVNLTKSDASEGFEQILDFLNVCVIQKKVIIIEDMVRQALRLDDADSIDCLPNEEIFTQLTRMGYEKPSTKLTFYKVFFSAQWKFLIQIILQCMSAKRTSWNEFSSSMASTINCLATGRKFNFSKYIFDSLVRNVDNSLKFYMYPRFLQLMINTQVGALSSQTTKYTSPALTQKVFANIRRVGKGFSRVDTSLFEGMLVPQQVPNDVDDVVANDIANTKKVDDLEQDKIAQAIEITKLKQRVRKLEKKRKLKASGLKRLRKDDEAEPAELTNVIEVVTTAKLMTEVVTAAATTVATTITTALMPKASAASRRKGVVIRDLEETTTPSVIVHYEPKSKVKRKERQDNTVMRRQALKRKLQTKAQARKNMMVYLKDMVGFKMNLFRGMTYDEIRSIFKKHFNSIVAFLEKGENELEEEASKVIKRKSKTFEEKAAKKQMLDEEVEELKTYLQIFPNDEDDVYTEATPLALKVPVVDYQVHTAHNEPYYKIIRADGSHRLFLNFINLSRNFDREDLEMLWKFFKKDLHL
nr:hypothetical protein [Tanacetum cinerariifolium]